MATTVVAIMIKSREDKLLEAKKKQWDEAYTSSNRFWDRIKKEIRRTLTDMMNGFMYNEKEKDKGFRWVAEAFWWLKMFFVYCAFRGLTFIIFGR